MTSLKKPLAALAIAAGAVAFCASPALAEDVQTAPPAEDVQTIVLAEHHQTAPPAEDVQTVAPADSHVV
ncbi:hypothetical protein [Streptomyces sp. JJ38]|uniref:hypothetical protein n=1 Tax=Streptomyces sp. JJ38 TaxID=2738128 RepID=UPI001C5A54CC|nr:hypothetical protein [Streptomyces sp. JJ38]MBW1600368.1 hypothetical protein [Streptomyces sp. JJ38]